jgi:hypothetical protein
MVYTDTKTLDSVSSFESAEYMVVHGRLCEYTCLNARTAPKMCYAPTLMILTPDQIGSLTRLLCLMITETLGQHVYQIILLA